VDMVRLLHYTFTVSILFAPLSAYVASKFQYVAFLRSALLLAGSLVYVVCVP